MWYHFCCAYIQNYTKFAKFTRLYIFHSLQYFATKLHNFIMLRMLFLAVLINFQNSKVCLIEDGSISKKIYVAVYLFSSLYINYVKLSHLLNRLATHENYDL